MGDFILNCDQPAPSDGLGGWDSVSCVSTLLLPRERPMVREKVASRNRTPARSPRAVESCKAASMAIETMAAAENTMSGPIL